MRSSFLPLAFLLAASCGASILPAQFTVPPAFAAVASPTSQWSTNFSDGLTFDALAPFTLNTVYVVVRPITATLSPVGNLTVNLRDNRGNLLATMTQVVGPYGQVINLGFSVPAGIGHQLEASGSTVPGLTESINVPSFNSFGVAGLVRIRGPIQAPLDRYPFFYDWRISGVSVPGFWQTSSSAAELAIFGPDTPPAILTDPSATLGAQSTSIARFRMGFAAQAYRTEAGMESDVPNALYDVGISPFPIRRLGAGGIATAAGQVININLDPQSLLYLNTGTILPWLQPLVGRPRLQVDFPSPRLFSAQMIVLDPSSLDGYVLSQAVEHTVVRAPAFEDFGSASTVPVATLAASRPGYSIPQAFAGGTGNRVQWQLIDTTRAANRSTSPTTAYFGSIFAHVPVFPRSPERSVLDTALQETALLTQNTLSFALNRMGSGVGTLSVFQIDGPTNSPILLRTYAGPDPSQSRGGLEWSLETIPFTPGGPFVQFRFDYQYSATIGGPGEIAIDAVRVQ